MKAGKGREQYAAQALCGEVVTRRVADTYGVTRRVTDTYAAPGGGSCQPSSEGEFESCWE